MKIGFNTMIWGFRLESIEEVLDTIAEAGYQGVEFGQRPDGLGVDDVEELRALLEARDLEFVGLYSGTLKERVDFCKDFRPSHLFLEHWALEHAPYAIEHGFTLALHPSRFTSVRRSEDALSLVEAHNELDLRVILDTAHMTIAGEDPIEAILNTKERLAAVHFKDWSPEFGRFSHRYGGSLKELGKGIVKLDPVLETLQEIDYDGWVIGELDRLSSNPRKSVVAYAHWFDERGVLPRPLSTTTSTDQSRDWIRPGFLHSCPPEAEIRFRERTLFAGTQGREAFYQSIAEAFNELIPSNLVTVWACSPAQNHVGVLYRLPGVSLKEGYVMEYSEGLTGIAIDRQRAVTYFDLTELYPGKRYEYPHRKFKHPALLEEMELQHMMVVPIYDLGNHSYVRLIVSLFPSTPELPLGEEELYWFSKTVAVAADMMLDRQCSFVSGRVNFLAGQCETAQSFLSELISLIQESLKCEDVAIFLVNEAGDRLELAVTTGTDWMVPEDERYYERNEHLVGRIWARNEPVLLISSMQVTRDEEKSIEGIRNKEHSAYLLLPFVDTKGEVVGVVRCTNKQVSSSSKAPNMFFEDDTSILDTIGQAAVPHLQILMDRERRARALGKLTHELRVPLVAIRGAAEAMQRTKGVRSFFDYDYPGDVWSWSELMRRLVGNADLYRYSSEGLPTQPVSTLLMADVIAPAVKQVSIFLRERGFSRKKIEYGDFREIPRLWLDRNQFQQVMFNLLANAINHCYEDPSSFRVEIESERDVDFLIMFRDYGPGIEYGMEEMIFNEGFRTPAAIERDVTGQGLGLWMVRQVIHAHDGEIAVTSRRHPTEFTIFLPEYLSRRRPN